MKIVLARGEVLDACLSVASRRFPRKPKLVAGFVLDAQHGEPTGEVCIDLDPEQDTADDKAKPHE